MNLAERLTLSLEKSGKTRAELTRYVGVKAPSVTGWFDGSTKSIKGDNLLKAAEFLGVRPEWLSTGKGEMNSPASLRPIALWEKEDDLPEGEYVFLPSLDVSLSAGAGTVVWHVDEKGQKQAFTAKWARRMGIDPECAATFVVSGSSMEPRLLDGDSVVIDYCQNDTIIDGKVYAIALDGEVYIKRIFKEFGGVRVVSDNPDKRVYPDRLVPADKMEYLKIIGRVVAVSGGM